jgi:hypothetical protein
MDTGRVGKNGKIFTDPTFHATLANAIEDIYNLEIKKGLRGSGDLKTAIERMVKIYEDFEKRLEPLRQLENPEMLWNRPINKINKK